jgi:hypothetical protein
MGVVLEKSLTNFVIEAAAGGSAIWGKPAAAAASSARLLVTHSCLSSL